MSRFPQLDDLDKVGIVERRRIFEEVEAQLEKRTLPDDVNDDTVAVKEFSIDARDAFQILVRSYIPLSLSSSNKTKERYGTVVEGIKGVERPVMVYLHAGGFLFGDLESGDMNCRVLAKRLQISVLNVGYRTAPEWKFPRGVEDAYDAVEWVCNSCFPSTSPVNLHRQPSTYRVNRSQVAQNAGTHLQANPLTGFIVGGISSGANLAAVTPYTARDTALSPPITALWLSIPVAILPSAYQHLNPALRSQLLSLEQNAQNPLLTAKSLGDIQDLYGCPPEDPRVSFLLNQRHAGLPYRLYMQVCGRDPLRDEAFLWEKLVREASGERFQSKIHL